MAKFDSKKLLKTLTASQGSILVPHIDRYLNEKKFPPTWNIVIPNFKERDPYYHPSGDCFLSPTDLWKKRQGLLMSKPVNAALQRTFDCGHMWHGYIQNILIDMGFVLPENVEKQLTHTVLSTPEFEVIGRGTADLVDVAIPGHGDWLVDIKTMNKVEFERGADQFTLLKWKAQVSCYMDWLGVEKAFILAISKDSPHAMREYQIVKDEKLLSEIYERWAYTEFCLAKGIEPDDRPDDIDPKLKNRGDSIMDEELAAAAPTFDK